MPAYLVGSYTIVDPEKYQQYVAKVGATLAPYNPKILVAGHEHTVVEGNPQPATIIIEFESKESAEKWYNSSEYQEIIHLRHEASGEGGWLIFAEQFIPPQE